MHSLIKRYFKKKHFFIVSTILIILLLLTSPVKSLTLSDTNSRITNELIHDIYIYIYAPRRGTIIFVWRTSTRLLSPLSPWGRVPWTRHYLKLIQRLERFGTTSSSMSPRQSVLLYVCVVKYVDATHQLNEAYKKLVLAGECKWSHCSHWFVWRGVDETTEMFLQANREFN